MMSEQQRDQDLEQRVYMERVRLFFIHANGAQLRMGVAAVFISLSLYFADVPLWHIVAWLALFGAVALFITVIELRNRFSALTPENAAFWTNLRVGLGLAIGAILGLADFLLPAQGAEVPELMVMVILVSAVAVICVGYTTMPMYYIGISASSMGLLTIGFLRTQDAIHYTFAAMAVLSQVIMLRKAMEVSRSAIEGIRTNERLKLEIALRQQAEQDAHDARDAALKASSAKSDFLANMSHELRTPMNAVIGFAGALQAGIAGPLNDKQTEYVEDIRNSGEHLLGLINQLLDLSKIEAGKFEPRYERIDLPALVEGCVRLLSRQAERGRVTIATDIPADLPSLQADPRLVSQLLVNLLSNAVKFSPPESTVRILVTLDPSGETRLSVIDSGAGIPPEDLGRVLLPFEQTELGKTKEGTGLGLPMVKRIAELHGGGFTIESEPGEGTTATVSLPVRVKPAPPDPQRPAA